MKSQQHRDQFAARLKEALADTGMPKIIWAKTMAKWLDKNQDNPMFAWKWMNGETQPRKENLRPLAQNLGVREEWLEYGTGQKYPIDQEKQQYIDTVQELFHSMSEEEIERAIRILEASL